MLQSRQLPPLPILVNRVLGRNVGLENVENMVNNCLYLDIEEHLADTVCSYQVENARAALDLYRYSKRAWESCVEEGGWPCMMPPNMYACCFL